MFCEINSVIKAFPCQKIGKTITEYRGMSALFTQLTRAPEHFLCTRHHNKSELRHGYSP